MPALDIKAAIHQATACYRAGDFAGAERLFRQVIAAEPRALHYADLGIVLAARGKFEDALAAYRRAIELDPKEPRPHYNLGNLLRDRGRRNAAAECYRQAIHLKPDYADAHNCLGMLALGAGRHGEARASLEAAVAADPRHHYAHNNLGNALTQLGLLEEAVLHYREAIALRPDYAEPYGNMGSVQLELDLLDEAISNCGKSVELNPRSATAHFNLANACSGALRIDDAIASHERALALAPDNAGFHWNYSTALLLKGDYARGWEEYEWRWLGCPELRGGKRAYPGREWDGSDTSGKTILLHAEQGLGDVIQFIRYAPLLAARGAKVIVVCKPELVRLLARVEGVSGAFALGQPLPDFDLHSHLLSLPRAFRTTLDTIPASIPYISADPALAASWRERIGSTSVLKVGLIWGGWTGNRIDRKRSIALADLAPLAGVGSVRFYGLQKGAQAVQAGSPPTGMDLTDWSVALTDLADTAALIGNLDLVVSVDTAGAHLAGAMGKPVWLLNRYQTDWRWLLGREDSPWYPTMRLFRQPEPGDWKTPIDRLAEALEKAARGRRNLARGG